MQFEKKTVDIKDENSMITLLCKHLTSKIIEKLLVEDGKQSSLYAGNNQNNESYSVLDQIPTPVDSHPIHIA